MAPDSMVGIRKTHRDNRIGTTVVLIHKRIRTPGPYVVGPVSRCLSWFRSLSHPDKFPLSRWNPPGAAIHTLHPDPDHQVDGGDKGCKYDLGQDVVVGVDDPAGLLTFASRSDVSLRVAFGTMR